MRMMSTAPVAMALKTGGQVRVGRGCGAAGVFPVSSSRCTHHNHSDSSCLSCDSSQASRRRHQGIRIGQTYCNDKSEAEVEAETPAVENAETKPPASPLALHLSSSRKRVTAAFLERLTVAELRKELELRGLQWRGLRKKELVEALLAGIENNPDPLPDAFEASVESYYRDPLAQRRYRVSSLKGENKYSKTEQKGSNKIKSSSRRSEAAPTTGHNEDASKSNSKEANSSRIMRRGESKSGRWKFFMDPIEAGCERYTGLDLHFLGTSSTVPTKERGVSAIAVRRDRAIWLFDCGEGTQIQMIRAKVRIGRVEKIFVSHLHGDHCYGLPGVVCAVSAARDQVATSMDTALKVYGPPGLSEFIRVSLEIGQVVLKTDVIVHEYSADLDFSKSSSTPELLYQRARGLYRVKLFPTVVKARSGKPFSFWRAHAEHDSNMGAISVDVAPLRHRVPSFGHVVREADLEGRLLPEKALARGLQEGPIFKELKSGKSVQAPDGSIVNPEDVIGPKRRGRKIVILGDTCNSSQIIPLARGADVLVHEATFETAMVSKALKAGHSTASMAGAFARGIGAKTLVLTHFSARYLQGQPSASISPESDNFMDNNDPDEDYDEALAIEHLVAEAQAEAGEDVRVIAACDFMHFNVDRIEPTDVEAAPELNKEMATSSKLT